MALDTNCNIPIIITCMVIVIMVRIVLEFRERKRVGRIS
jgi:Mg2+/citrate symporter